jgi:hypothetical protein
MRFRFLAIETLLAFVVLALHADNSIRPISVDTWRQSKRLGSKAGRRSDQVRY